MWLDIFLKMFSILVVFPYDIIVSAHQLDPLFVIMDLEHGSGLLRDMLGLHELINQLFLFAL